MYIQTKDLVKTYKSRNVVDRVSVRVEEGEIVGLLGPNGAGKTTTFYMIVGVEKPSAGSIYIGDTDITHMPMYKRSAHGIGYLPQEASIFRNLTVEDNILAMLETTTGNDGISSRRVSHYSCAGSIGHPIIWWGAAPCGNCESYRLKP